MHLKWISFGQSASVLQIVALLSQFRQKKNKTKQKKTSALPCSTSPRSHYAHSRCQMTKEYAAFSKHLLWSVLFHFNPSWLLYWLLSLCLICMPALHQVDYNHLFALAVFFEGLRHLSLWWKKNKKRTLIVFSQYINLFTFPWNTVCRGGSFLYLPRKKNHNYCTATGKMWKTLCNFVILYSGNEGCWEYRPTQDFLVFLFQMSNRENCFICSEVMCLQADSWRYQIWIYHSLHSLPASSGRRDESQRPTRIRSDAIPTGNQRRER